MSSGECATVQIEAQPFSLAVPFEQDPVQTRDCGFVVGALSAPRPPRRARLRQPPLRRPRRALLLRRPRRLPPRPPRPRRPRPPWLCRQLSPRTRGPRRAPPWQGRPLRRHVWRPPWRLAVRGRRPGRHGRRGGGLTSAPACGGTSPSPTPPRDAEVSITLVAPPRLSGSARVFTSHEHHRTALQLAQQAVELASTSVELAHFHVMLVFADELPAPDVSKEQASQGALQVFEVLSLPTDMFCNISIDLELPSHMLLEVDQYQPWPPPDELRLMSCDAARRRLTISLPLVTMVCGNFMIMSVQLVLPVTIRHHGFATANGVLHPELKVPMVLKHARRVFEETPSTYTTTDHSVHSNVGCVLQQRIQSRSNLHRRKESPICKICQCEDETPEHIIYPSPFVAMLCTKLGINLNPDKPISNLVLSVRPATIPDVQFPIFMVLCYWQLWKCRNGFIFRNEALNLKQVLASCKVETNLWRYRLPVP